MNQTAKVLDLSHHNCVLDFEDICSAGIRGVIHKATEGRTLHDAAYAGRRHDALDAGLLWGAYHFLRPGNMRDQARRFIDFAQPTEMTLLAADHEDSRVRLSDLCDFLDEIHDLIGYRAVIYSGFLIKEQLGNQADARLDGHPLWLAQYSSKPKWPLQQWKAPWLWQYSDQGHVGGVSGKVDVNAFERTDEELAAEWSGPLPEAA